MYYLRFFVYIEAAQPHQLSRNVRFEGQGNYARERECLFDRGDGGGASRAGAAHRLTVETERSTGST